MKGILRYLSGAVVAVALLLAGSGAAHAQNWPTTSSNLSCNWTLSSGGTVTGGTSTIRFSLGSVVSDYTGIYRTGTLTTTYPGGSSTVKPVKVIWDWSASHADTFVFQQTQDNITCSSTRTFDSGSITVFDLCSNGAFQYCRP
jgi:hypothetical protein